MIRSAPTETRDHQWSPVLSTLRADALDCVQANLAAIADRWHGAGTHLALGGPLRFSTEDGAHGLPAVAASVDRRLAEAQELLGLTVAARWDGLDGPELRRLAAETGPLYVVADAYRMGWVPYAGQRHLEHTFLLSQAGGSRPAASTGSGVGSLTVVDAYHNDTPWGLARPGVWRLSPAELDDAVSDATALVIRAEPAPALDPAAVLAANARAMAAAASEIDGYVRAIRDHADSVESLDQLVLDVWLLGRSRQLHAAWLGTVHSVPADRVRAAEAQAQEWLALASHTYVAMRRARRGGALPRTVTEALAGLLHADVALAGRLATHPVLTTVDARTLDACEGVAHP